MEKIDNLSKDEQDILKFIYLNREKQENYKAYFEEVEKFAIMARLKRNGYISNLVLGKNGEVESLIPSEMVIEHFEQ